MEVAPNSSTCIETITKKIAKTVKGSELEKQIKDKYFSFLLPKEESAKFYQILKIIQRATEKGHKGEGITKYAIRSTSLDEVFLHLGREAEGVEEILEVKGLAKDIVLQRLSRKAQEEEGAVEDWRVTMKKSAKPGNVLYDRLAIFKGLAMVLVI